MAEPDSGGTENGEPENQATPVVSAGPEPALARRRSRVRRVRLADPPTVDGRVVAAIEVRPATLGDLLLWQGGAGAMDLLGLMTGEPPEVLAAIRFPDADRVLRAFHAQLPADIRSEVVGR